MPSATNAIHIQSARIQLRTTPQVKATIERATLANTKTVP